ncbi:MBL fold metallo-hydrolase [Candidatus Micrarchaeota archaeon]|nr:MBL fold metallo-hydrolase [Candidatus Micrarchaeota archaeon]
MKKIAENLLEIEGKSLCSNVYLLIHGKKALMIDSGDGSNFEEIEKALSGLELAKVILTHGHLDHIGGMRYLKKQGLLHKADLKILDDLNSCFPAFSKAPRNISELISKFIKFGGFELEVIHTSGHTPGSVCLFDRKSRILFSGDTLFAGGYFGRTDLTGGDGQELMKSLEKIKKLNYKVLCPGHDEIECVV